MARRTSKNLKKIKKAKDTCPKIAEKAFDIDTKLWRLNYQNLKQLEYYNTIHTIDNLKLYKAMMEHLGTTEAALEEWKKKIRATGKVEKYRVITMGEIPMFAYSNQNKKKFEIVQVTIDSVHEPRQVTVTWPITPLSGRKLKDHQKDCEIHNTQRFELCQKDFVKDKKITILESALAARERAIYENEMASKKQIDELVADFEKKAKLADDRHEEVVNQQKKKIEDLEKEKAEVQIAVNNLITQKMILNTENEFWKHSFIAVNSHAWHFVETSCVLFPALRNLARQFGFQ